MKTTIQLSDHIHSFLFSICRREKKTLGEKVEELVLLHYSPAGYGQNQQGSSKAGSAREGDIPLLPSRADAKPVTPEMVDDLLSGLED